jgi:hypothetical protein
MEAVQREVAEGGLLRDCLELGANDLKGFLPRLGFTILFHLRR